MLCSGVFGHLAWSLADIRGLESELIGRRPSRRGLQTLQLVRLLLTEFQSASQRVNLLTEMRDLVVLHHNDDVLLLHLLLVLDLQLFAEPEGALELRIQLAYFLIDAEQDLLLAHYFNRLEALSFFPRPWDELLFLGI